MIGNSISLVPQITLQMRQDPEVIPHRTYEKCAAWILDNIDETGYFRGEKTIDETEFDIDCRVVCSPYRQDRGVITGVHFFHAFASTYGEDGYEINNDFSPLELEDYIVK